MYKYNTQLDLVQECQTHNPFIYLVAINNFQIFKAFDKDIDIQYYFAFEQTTNYTDTLEVVQYLYHANISSLFFVSLCNGSINSSFNCSGKTADAIGFYFTEQDVGTVVEAKFSNCINNSVCGKNMNIKL